MSQTDFRKVSNSDLFDKFVDQFPDDAVIAEMAKRASVELGRPPVLPCGVDNKPPKDATLKFLNHLAALRGNGRAYQLKEWMGLPLVQFSVILAAPKAKLVLNPGTGIELAEDGMDPGTGQVFPIANKDQMSQICWVFEHLPTIKPSFDPTDADAQHDVIQAVTGAGSISPTMKTVLARYAAADQEAKDAVARRLTVAYWDAPRASPTRFVAPSVKPAIPEPSLSAPSVKPALPEEPAPSADTKLRAPQALSGPKKLYVIYGKGADLQNFVSFMAPMSKLVQLVHEQMIPGGMVRKKFIDEQYRAADGFVYLVNADTLAKCGTEIQILRRLRPDAMHIPVLTSPSGFEFSDLADLSPLPMDGYPISDNPQARWAQVATEITRMITAS